MYFVDQVFIWYDVIGLVLEAWRVVVYTQFIQGNYTAVHRPSKSICVLEVDKHTSEAVRYLKELLNVI